MQGTSGTFAVNGTELQLQPSSYQWMGRVQVGTDGNNRAIYPAIREFELAWDLISHVDLAQIINVQLACVTGTVVFDLPKWGDLVYQFYSYSGTSVREPQVGSYFVDHVTDVKLLIANIKTN